MNKKMSIRQGSKIAPLNFWQEKNLEISRFLERRRPDLNRWIEVLQTYALPLGYCAVFNFYGLK
ncbi:hypothetical protein CLOBOL_05616 [Enterocloster bolteae ATCC BAA-613]|jgi:hypothetical protein|uniref:Uncharacterized protein n=1 Tax=Enterocloster bolteae (strain ATCC BAA-613 / DSM 15670 / CCUG 46953 / JCM 12243 / WAL 16351) TaxID=411902 RepID=A8S090_ENTBW|nr:hypothetical protein CLOBOL_05616 [Enterocloster bolteae ATCC BAA-613]